MHTLLQSLTIWVTILLILCCILLSHCYWRGHNWTLLHLHYHQCWIERKHPFSWSGWLHSWLDFSAARTCYWLTFNLLSSQIPRCLKICFLYSQSTSRTFGRDYLILDAGFCISLHWTLWGACLFFHSVKVPVKTSPEVQHMDSLWIWCCLQTLMPFDAKLWENMQYYSTESNRVAQDETVLGKHVLAVLIQPLDKYKNVIRCCFLVLDY